MLYVSKLCHDGITVCATVHSPSPGTFQLFGRLLLLLAGKVVYFGENGDACIKYFLSTPGMRRCGRQARTGVWLGASKGGCKGVQRGKDSVDARKRQVPLSPDGHGVRNLLMKPACLCPSRACLQPQA